MTTQWLAGMPAASLIGTLVWLLLITEVLPAPQDYLHLANSFTPKSTTTIDQVSISPDGNFVAMAFDFGVEVWKKDSTGAYNLSANLVTTSRLWSSQFSSDGSFLLAGGFNTSIAPRAVVYLWKYNSSAGSYSNTSTNLTNNAVNGRIWKVMTTTNLSRILAADEDGFVSYWDLSGGSYIFKQSIPASPSGLYALSVRSGDVLITGGIDMIVRVFNYNGTSYNLSQSLSSSAIHNDVDLSFDEKFVAASLNNGIVMIWSLAGGAYQPFQNITYYNTGYSGNASEVTFVRFNKVGDRLLVAGRGSSRLTLWAYNTPTNVFVFRSYADNAIYGLDIDNTTHVIACGYNSSTCQVYSLRLNCSEDIYSDGVNVGDTACGCTGAYVWSATTSQCGLNCSSAAYSTGTASASGCNCIANYYWNSTAALCYLNCSSILHSASNANATACNCETSYNWNSSACWLNCSASIIADSSGTNIDSTSCNCNTGFSFVGGVCYRNCSSSIVQYSSGNYNRTDCNCIVGYYWSAATCTINCGLISNSNGTNQNSTSCYCNTNYIWQPSTCWLDCTAFSHTTTNASSTSCNCISGYAWNVTACWYVCSGVSFSTSTNVDAVTCGCISGYFWNATGMNCWRNCSAIANASTNTGQSACSCTSGFVWNAANGQCFIDCSAVSHSTTNNIDRLTCECSANYNWSSNVCVPTCTNQPTGDSNYDYTTCQCKSGYFMSAGVCWIDCTLVAYSNKTNIDKSKCYCNLNFAWVSTQCLINCSADSSSTRLNTSASTCACHNGFSWMNGQCTRNCGADAYSNGTNRSVRECYCLSNFIWDSPSSKCVRNCSIPGGLRYDETNCSNCMCLSQFDWSIPTNSCDINCTRAVNERLTQEVTQVVPVNFSSTSCTCPPGYVWNISLYECYLNCSQKTNSIGQNINATACVCMSKYVWSGSQCRLDCQNIPNAVALSIANNQECNCKLAFYWQPDSKTCGIGLEVIVTIPMVVLLAIGLIVLCCCRARIREQVYKIDGQDGPPQNRDIQNGVAIVRNRTHESPRPRDTARGHVMRLPLRQQSTTINLI